MLLRCLPGSLNALLTLGLLSSISALRVSPGSPCASQCLEEPSGNSLDDRATSTTNTSDIVCSDIDFFSSTAGLKFKDCVSCLQTSRGVKGDDSDSAWFLYNLRFASDVCLFGFPSTMRNESSPCNNDYACSNLQSALQTDILKPTHENEFGYCTANNSVFRGQVRKACVGCLQATRDSAYLSNFLIALEAGCQQQPAPGALLGLSGSLFTESAVNITDAPSNETSSNQGSSHTTLAVGTIVGISVAAALLFLGGGSLFLVYWRRQRRFDREDEIRRGGRDDMYRPYTGVSSITTAANRGPYFSEDPKDALFASQVVVNNGIYSKPGTTFQCHQQPGIYDGLPGYTASDSAIPAHPAYIPRALMRKKSTSTVATNTQVPPNPVYTPSTIGGQPPTPPAAPDTSSSSTHSPDPRTRFHLGQVSLPSSHEASPMPSPPLLTPPAPQLPLANMPPPPSGPPPPKVPSMILPSASRLRQQRKRYSPPRLGGGTPIPGREDMAITGPLAFPEQQQVWVGDESAGGLRTFRERSTSSPAVAGRRRSGRASTLFNFFGGGGEDRNAEQAAAAKKRYEEVPLGGGESDLYG